MTKTIDSVLATEISAPMKYLGGQVLTPANASATCTLPSGTNCVMIVANGNKCYYAINSSGDAAATSPGLVPDGSRWMEGPLTNLTSLKVFMASGTAHVLYYQA